MKKVLNPYLYETDYFDNKSAKDLFNDSDAVGIDSKEYAHSLGGYRFVIKFMGDVANNPRLFLRINNYLKNNENILYYEQDSFEKDTLGPNNIKECPMWNIVMNRCTAVYILELFWGLCAASKPFRLERSFFIEEDDYKDEYGMLMAAEDDPDDKTDDLPQRITLPITYDKLLLNLRSSHFINYTREGYEALYRNIDYVLQMVYTKKGRQFNPYDVDLSECFPFVAFNYFIRQFESSFRHIMQRENGYWKTTIHFEFERMKYNAHNSFRKSLSVVCRSKMDYLFKMNLIDVVIFKLRKKARDFDYRINMSIEIEDCVNPFVKIAFKNDAIDRVLKMLDWTSKKKLPSSGLAANEAEYYFIPMSDTSLSFKNNINKTFNRLADFTKATDLEYISNLI